jgi:hypothetical protein
MFTGTLIRDLMATVERAERNAGSKRTADDRRRVHEQADLLIDGSVSPICSQSSGGPRLLGVLRPITHWFAWKESRLRLGKYRV